MDLIQQFRQPVLKPENADVLCKLHRFRFGADVAPLLKIGFLLIPMLIIPVVCGAGNKEPGHAGHNDHQQKHCVDAGEDRQVHQQAACILQKHRQRFPDVLRGLIVSAAREVRFFTELCKALLQCVGIRGAIAFIRKLSDDRGADIHTGEKRVLLDILLQTLDQKQRGSEDTDGHQQLSYGHPLLHPGKHLRRNV